jgi:type VI secretion system protein ImpJ
MRNQPVHWSEGMFLRPHHFQAAERYWTEASHLSEHWDHHYHYGINSIRIREEAVGNYQVQIDACEARMPDGTLISFDVGQEPDRKDLKPSFDGQKKMTVGLQEAFEKTREVRVFLAVPKLKMGAVNVSAPGTDGVSRYHGVQQDMQDETLGGNDQSIEVRALNVRLLLSTEDPSGYELLPILQIERSGEGQAAPRVDARYFPPALCLDAWPELGRGIVRAIYDLIGKKIQVLAEQVLTRGISLVSQEPGDLDRIQMLIQLNEAYASLGVLTFASGIHPIAAYGELCRIMGRLSIFGPRRRVPEVPRYDHDNLAPIFYWVKQQIEYLLNCVRDYEYEQRFFQGVGLGMSVTLEPKWLNVDWDWYVGVRHGDLAEEECRKLLSPEDYGLDWKLGSSRQVDILFKNRADGVHLIPLKQAPRALPHTRDWLYYHVSRDNLAWKDVQLTQTLAMRLKDELIVNRDKLQGKQNIQVKWRDKQVVLQFALFAVPKQQ